MSLDENSQNRIFSLWDRLADFDISRSQDARIYLLEGLCELVDAQNATWVGAVLMGLPHQGIQ